VQRLRRLAIAQPMRDYYASAFRSSIVWRAGKVCDLGSEGVVVGGFVRSGSSDSVSTLSIALAVRLRLRARRRMAGMPLSKDAMQRHGNIIKECITAGEMLEIFHTNAACSMQASPSKQLIGLAGPRLPRGITRRKKQQLRRRTPS
jgi:hypothetical protein